MRDEQQKEDRIISSGLAIFYELGENEPGIKDVKRSIEEIKKETRARAKKENFPDDSHEEEFFSLLYKEGESLRDGVELNTAEQMMEEAFFLKREGYYTFFINGDRKSEGGLL